MKHFLALCWLVLSSACFALEEEAMPFPARGQVPPGYAPAYETTIRAAENEASLVIYATTDTAVAKYLIADFRTLYPRIEVEYEDLNSTELHYRFVAETQLGGRSADVVWSSAMDQQTGLVNRGYALAYESPELARLPDWAKWKSQAFATTFEPVAIAYNKGLLHGRRGAAHACRPRSAAAGPARPIQGQGRHLQHREVGARFLPGVAGRRGVARLLGRGPRARQGGCTLRADDRCDAQARGFRPGHRRLQRARLLRPRPGRSESVRRLRVPERLHPGRVAAHVHQQEGQPSERRQVVGGLCVVQARPDRDRQQGPPLCGAQRRGRRASPLRTSSRCWAAA